MSVTAKVLSESLVLNQWALQLFGCSSLKELAYHINDDALQGLDEQNIHRFCNALLLHIPQQQRPSMPDDDILRYDSHISSITIELNEFRDRSRGGVFRWMYFQYLSLLFTEVYLDRFFRSPATLRDELNRSIVSLNKILPTNHHITPYDENIDPRSQLNRLAFWMATGSGKTLLMHAHILQYIRILESQDRLGSLDRVIVVTPNEGLSQQHLKEFSTSGIDARLFNKRSSRLFSRTVVEILEISKLSDTMGDKTVAVESLEGNNLVLIDEGHRGLGAMRGNSGSIQSAWLRRRDQLCEDGFSVEYSATFGHAIKGRSGQKREHIDRYAKSVLFDYSYRWFHRDGYGKDYRIFNLNREQQDQWRFHYLTAALLSFFQQQRVYDNAIEELQRFGVERPLWVFVGGSVTKGFSRKEASDIIDILQFLKTYIEDRARATSCIRVLLKNGLSAIQCESSTSDQFHALLESNVSAEQVYSESLRLLFNATSGGALHVELLRSTAGELALRVADNPPFGVINVGDARKLFKHCDKAGIHATQREFAESLFHGLNDEESTINLLVGARKFMEGWSSWRVSSMGLMNVGRSEGSQVIQLFGRGVRLRGKDGSLKRSSALAYMGLDRPKHIDILETLQVFGIRANYMSHFRSILEEDGIALDTIELAIPIDSIQLTSELRLPRLEYSVAGDDPSTAFRRVGPILVLSAPCNSDDAIVVSSRRNGDEFNSGSSGVLSGRLQNAIHRELSKRPAVIDWYPKIRAISSSGDYSAGGGTPSVTECLRNEHLAHLNIDRLFVELQRYKCDRGWHNLTISRSLIPQILVGSRNGAMPLWYRLRIPTRELEFIDQATIEGWQEIALAILKKYASKYYATAQQAWESRHLTYRRVSENDPNYPRLVGEDSDRYGYRLEVTGDSKSEKVMQVVREIDEIVSSRGNQSSLTARRDMRSQDRLLEALEFDRHLYRPLISTRDSDIRVIPTGLNDGEVCFVKNLRAFYDQNRVLISPGELFLMRNLSRGKGVSFFDASNFHPDFILWVIEDRMQRVAFVDPKGLVHEGPDSPKVNLYRTIKDIEKQVGDSKVQLDSFIVSVTPRAELCRLWNQYRPSWFQQRHIVFQEDGLVGIREIFVQMGILDR